MALIEEALEELASAADIEGINWQSLNASGLGLMQSDHYLDLIDARWEKFYNVAESLDISDAEWEETTAEQARDAWTEVKDALSAKADAMLDALSRGDLMVAWDEAATIWTGALRRLIIAASHVAHSNLAAHADGTVRYAIETGQTTVADAENDADRIARIFSAVAKLDQWGALEDLKKTSAVSGLGQAQAVATRSLPMVIAAIGIAAVIGAVVVFVAYLSHRNEMLEKYCFDEAGNLRSDAPPWCLDPPDPLSVFLQPFERLASGVSVAITIGVVIWVGALVLPRVVQAAKKARA